MATITITINGKDNASNAIRGVSGSLNMFQSIVGGILTAGIIQRLAQGIFDLGKTALDSTVKYERFTAVMTSMTAQQMVASGEAKDLRSAWSMAGDEAQDLMEWMQKLAINSPFGTEDVVNAFKMAQAYGFQNEKAQQMTETMVNWAAATGRSGYEMEAVMRALGQMQATGKVMGQDLMQLTNAGIGVSYISEALGMTTEQFYELKEKGLDAGTTVDAILKKLSNDWADAGDLQKNTMFGLTNSLADLKEMRLRDFFAGAFEAAKPVIIDIVAKLQDPAVIASIKAWGEGFGNFVATMVQLGGLLSGGDINKISEFFAGLGLDPNLVLRIQGLAINLKQLFSGKITPLKFMEYLGVDPALLEQISILIDNIMGAMSGTKGGDPKFFLDSLKEIGQLMTGNLIKVLEMVNKHFDVLMLVLKAVGYVAIFVAGAIVVGFIAVQNIISGVLTGFTFFVNMVKTNLATFGQGLGSMAAGVLGVWKGVWNMLAGLFTGNFDRIKFGFLQWALSIKAIVMGLFQAIYSIVMIALAPITSMLKTWYTTIVGIFRSLADVLVGHSIIPDMLTAIFRWFTSIFVAIIQVVVSSLIGIVTFVMRAGAMLSAAFKTILTIAFNVVNGFMGKFVSVGKSIITGLVQGIKSNASAVADALSDIVNDAIEAIKRDLGIASPSKVTMGIATNMMKGFTKGFEDYGAGNLAVSMQKNSFAGAAVAGGGGGGGITLINYGTVNNGSRDSKFGKSLREMR